MSQFKYVALAVLAALTSCSEDLGLTSVKEAETLDASKHFSVNTEVQGIDFNATSIKTRGILVPSTQQDVEKNGFNVTMFTQTAKNAWKQGSNTTGVVKFTKEGSSYTSKDALWTQAGINDVYAVYSYQNSLYYDQSNSNHLVSSEVYPLDNDPIVGHYKGTYNNEIKFDMYHAAAQIRLDVENKSDYDIRVSGKVVAYYGAYATNFTWKEPTDYRMSNGTVVKKLPNECWKVSDNNFVAAALGTTAGSINDPYIKGQGVKTLTRVNVVPILFKGDDNYPATQIEYTIYWQKNNVDQEPIVYTLPVSSLRAGVCTIYKLNIEGDRFPLNLAATSVNVDEFTDETVEWTVKPWEATKYSVEVTSNSDEMGTVTPSGLTQVTSGEQLEIKATPKTGFKFVKWSDGNTSATRKIDVTKNIKLEAIFAKYKALYVQSNTAWQVTKDDAMTLGSDGHTWSKTITASGITGFIVPTGTGFQDKVFNLDKSKPGHLKLLDPTETYVYIPITDGTWLFTFNDKTLEYTLVKQGSVEEAKASLKKALDDYESTYGDINDYDNITEASKKAVNDAVAKARELYNKATATYQELFKAKQDLDEAIKNIKTTEPPVDIEQPGVKS